MGLLAVGAAAGGPLATAAVLLHMLGHGLAQSTLFLGAGHMLQATGTSRIGGIRALAVRAPVLAGLVSAGILALIGFPPFSMFASELAIARAGFTTGLGWLTAAAFVLVLVIAAALVGHTSRMLLGSSPDGPGAATAPYTLPAGAAITLVIALAVCAAIGMSAIPLAHLLQLAADVLTGTP
jgi:hydrogenase-4 component F